jgi:hypothetical protein
MLKNLIADSLAGTLDDVFIVIDGLDECGNSGKDNPVQ